MLESVRIMLRSTCQAYLGFAVLRDDAIRQPAVPCPARATLSTSMTLRNTCELVVGRLLEIRVAAGYHLVEDVDAMIAMIGEQVATLPPHAKYAIVADWRAVRIMPPATAERAREMLASVNPRVTRSSILTLPEDPTTNLQVVRLVREAQNPNRRHFTSPDTLAVWLSEVLTPAEANRLSSFLAR